MHPIAAPTSQPRDRAAINRENAQHSTGPKTPEGKANVKLNAIRHGACAQQIVFPGEDLEAYSFLGVQLLNHWQPATAIERKLVRTLQENEWRLARLRTAETNLWSLGITEQIEKYEHYDEPTRLAFAQAAAFRANARHFDQIGRHENRINKLLKETEAQLREEINNRTDDPAAASREQRIETVDPMQPETATDAPKPEKAAAAGSGFVLQTHALQHDALQTDALPTGAAQAATDPEPKNPQSRPVTPTGKEKAQPQRAELVVKANL